MKNRCFEIKCDNLIQKKTFLSKTVISNKTELYVSYSFCQCGSRLDFVIIKSIKPKPQRYIKN